MSDVENVVARIRVDEEENPDIKKDEVYIELTVKRPKGTIRASVLLREDQLVTPGGDRITTEDIGGYLGVGIDVTTYEAFRKTVRETGKEVRL